MTRTYGNCPECNYSATPDEHLGKERKHFWPHSLECVRCGYRTETKATWPEAIAAWNGTKSVPDNVKMPETMGNSQPSPSPQTMVTVAKSIT